MKKVKVDPLEAYDQTPLKKTSRNLRLRKVMSSGNFPTYLKLSPERISSSLAKQIHHVNKKLTIPSASSSVK
jgi:hypothetical protein